MSRATNQQIAQGFAQGLQNFTQGYIKRKDREHAQTVLDNPDSTPVQKAIAWESIAEGTGHKAYDSILKEQALRKEEANTTNIRNEINGVQTDVGERAQVGKVEPFNSPVDYANQMLSPEQMQQMGPEEQAYGQQLPNEPMTPAMQAMAQTKQQPALEQGGQQQPKKPGIQDVDTERLQEFLGQTKDAPTIRQIQSELKRRSDLAHDQAKTDAAIIKVQGVEATEHRKQIREYAAPLDDLQKVDRGVRNLEEGKKILQNGNFSMDEATFQTAIGAILEGKGKDEIAQFFKTPDQQKMMYLLYDYIKPKELGGSNPSTKEVLIAMSKQPNPYKGKSANMFIMQNMIDDARIQQAKAFAIAKYRDDPNQTFAQFKSKVDAEVAPQAELILKDGARSVAVSNAKEMIKDKKLYIPPGAVPMMDQEGNIKAIPANKVSLMESKEFTDLR